MEPKTARFKSVEKAIGSQTQEIDKVESCLISLENEDEAGKKDTVIDKGKYADTPEGGACLEEVNEAMAGSILLGQVVLELDVQARHQTLRH